MNFLNLAKTNEPFMAELEEAASRVIRSGCYLHGPETKAFEKELAAQCGARFAIGVSNGLDALRLIIRGYMELGLLLKGDGVMVAGNTYIATLLPVTEFGLSPIIIDPDPDTMNFDWEQGLDVVRQLKEAGWKGRVKAVIVTHLYGTPSWNLEIARKFHEQDIFIFEDNAQAIGALAAEPGLHGTRMTGNLADAAAFSFYPTKNIGALGDAGAVVTDDRQLADTVRALANYGSTERYYNRYAGYNCRLDELQAAMLRIKLRHLDAETERRNAVADAYAAGIKNGLVTLPKKFADMRQVWHQYVIRVPEALRDPLRDYLAKAGIATDVHYPTPPVYQPCYEKYFDMPDDDPSLKFANSCISLPIANVTPEQAAEVARVINEFKG
ncbi:MAG: DegT/DnrJ/EryC1/StrS family aminotransferase [Muribaculaceae bacterium]|nr:DegT/DnrJ/EryC1/StrS family aminotransferase [Muribaculaceae bacterium]